MIKKLSVFLTLLVVLAWTDTSAIPISDTDTLEFRTKALDEVVVSARRRLFKYSANRFEYDVAADSALRNANMLQAMRRIPVLETTADSRISSLEGLPLVYKLNGLKDPMLSGDISQVLTALPSSLVARVEIRKATEEDRGTVMEVNIVTKSRLEGYRASLSTYLTDLSWRNGVWGMSKVRRFNFSGNYTNTWIYGHDMTTGTDETRDVGGQEYRLHDEGTTGPYRTDLHSVELTGSYDTGESSFLSLYARGIFKQDPRQGRSMTRNVTGPDGATLLAYGFTDNTAYRDNEYEASLRWEKSFVGIHPANLYLGYEFYNRPTGSDETGEYEVTAAEDPSLMEGIYDFRHAIRKDYTTHTAHAEGTYRINKRNEIGMYGRMRLRHEDWDNTVEKTYLLAPTAPKEAHSSSTGLRELFGSLFPKYAHYGNRWEMTAGVLVQAYRHSVSATGISERISNTRLTMLPYGRVALITRNGILLELSYEMRSQVPDITALDPYVNTDNAGEATYGNPYLKPQKSHDLRLRMSKTLRKFYTSVNVGYVAAEDVILSRVFMKDGLLNRTFDNIGSRRTFNAGGFTSGRLFPKTFLRLTAGASYVDYRASALEMRNRGWQWNVSARCEQELPWNLFLDANGSFSSSPVMLQGRGARNFGYGLSLYRSFLAGSLSVSLTASSFAPVWYRGTTTVEAEGYRASSWTRSFHADFALGVSYSFGKLRSDVKSSTFSMENKDIKKSYDE